MPEMLTFEETIASPIERVYDAFLNPDDLLQWHRASEDWTTPHAVTDPQVGGAFNIGFGDPTGENTFDFTGTYTELDRPSRIRYTVDDGRDVDIIFRNDGENETTVVWSFEPEGTMPAELQRQGWAAQLANLKTYLEQR